MYEAFAGPALDATTGLGQPARGQGKANTNNGRPIRRADTKDREIESDNGLDETKDEIRYDEDGLTSQPESFESVDHNDHCTQSRFSLIPDISAESDDDGHVDSNGRSTPLANGEQHLSSKPHQDQERHKARDIQRKADERERLIQLAIDEDHERAAERRRRGLPPLLDESQLGNNHRLLPHHTDDFVGWDAIFAQEAEREKAEAAAPRAARAARRKARQG